MIDCLTSIDFPDDGKRKKLSCQNIKTFFLLFVKLHIQLSPAIAKTTEGEYVHIQTKLTFTLIVKQISSLSWQKFT
ncbi:hypothetical protein [Calothrix sp. 336/3]|uniref:hypothetical protein n=1 Tax=Calothrix sp. 336/3 TaxID=1337936 RepID=UPI000551B470|nr:hypothetical protein [Calothrix sp. 336/3]AKG19927.1 hypothetical protein IJ00_00075 [Calothrix sp. 336/3]